ncbi:protein asteroid homolog 1, partial [Salmo salar]|uniref:Protein asteroid homolog 1 n=1 Tax=Salmo salar TaxID=8030 RepID=A0ABM3EEV5_SALSA
MPSLIGDKNADVVSRGMIDYDIPETLPSYLEGFFSNDVAPGLDCLPTPLRVLPDWTLLLLMKGKLPSRIVNVLLHKRVMQSAQVENHALVSGNTTSQFIRQVLYGLLLLGSSPVKEHDRKGKNLRTDGRKADPSSQKVSEVKEYDREGTELTYRMVKAILPSAAQHLQLDTLDKAPHSVRLEVFLETLRVSQSTLNGIPPHLELPVAVTYYWLRHAHPQPDRPLLQALLLGLVYGEFCRERKCQGVEAEGPVLERLRELTQNPVGADLNLGVAHAYSQWQCCLREGLNLNQLLCFPLTEPQCAWLYRGTLVHQLVTKLRGGLTPDSLLIGGPCSGQLYRAMLGAILNSHDASVIPLVSVPRKATPPSLTQPLDDLTA